MIRSQRKSLRTILMFWFLVFAVVPLSFLTGFSLVKYEQSLNEELKERLKVNQREILAIFADFERAMTKNINKFAADKSLGYDLALGAKDRLRLMAEKRMQSHFIHRMMIFNHAGQSITGIARSPDNSNLRAVRGNVSLSAEFIGGLRDRDQAVFANFVRPSVRGRSGILELVVFTRIRTANQRVAGYIEDLIRIDAGFLRTLKNRLNLEILLLSKDGKHAVATHPDLSLQKSEVFLSPLTNGSRTGSLDLTIQETPYSVLVQGLQWGSSDFYLGTGTSKKALRGLVKEMSRAFLIVFIIVVGLLIVLSLIISRILLRPLSDLVTAIQTMDINRPTVEVVADTDTELGLLAESFNAMSRRVYEAQKELRDKITELEKANDEIRDTQEKLVHAAKMSSLGQLVAGIAHELNNPIGFIYSNMSHLRDYSERLVHLIDVAENDPKKLVNEKKKAEFNYLVDDLPKLITSCEEGARRTRDIVLGLRNFSRMESAEIKEVDLHECIDNTLKLLAGELKNRIQVTKDYRSLPKIYGYPSQLNQVFMNILTNAAQAIEGKGEIFISTQKTKAGEAEIRIRDTGKGISAKNKDRIFDPFFTTKDVGQGTGLGMSITYGIVKRHGGDILIDSEVGKGTEVLITLPLRGLKGMSKKSSGDKSIDN